MKNIIILIFLFSYFHKSLLYPFNLYLENNYSSTFNISINDIPKNESKYYEENFYSGSKILVETSIHYNYRLCINIYGYINYNESDNNNNENTSLLFKYESIKRKTLNNYCDYIYNYYNYIYNKIANEINCDFYCLDFDSDCNFNDHALLTAYIPFKCEDDVNDTYYLNIRDKINIYK